MSDKNEKHFTEDALASRGEIKKSSGSLKRKKHKKKRDKKSLKIADNNDQGFLNDLEKFTKGLIYISETDAEVFPFVGEFAEEVSGENLLKQLEINPETHLEEIDVEDFFRHPMYIQDWFDEERIKIADQYSSLESLLKDKLKDLRVFKIGQINIDIYIVGLDSENKIMGIKTKAVET